VSLFKQEEKEVCPKVKETSFSYLT